VIDHDMIACWKVNYGLDTRTPADAMRYWDERCNGMAPAGAVAALGLCIDEIERLRSERLAFAAECDDLRTELAEARRDAERYRWLRDVACDVPEGIGVARFHGCVREEIVWGDDLDAAIEAARKETP
jgi:hypothetical protein